MKKRIAIIIVLMLMLTLLSSCNDDIYSYEIYVENDMEIAYSEKLQDAAIGNVFWSGDSNDMDIIIPNTYKDAKVTSLGGLFVTSAGLGFEISGANGIPIDSQYNTRTEVDNWLRDLGNTTDVVFNLYIGDNLNVIAEDYMYVKVYRVIRNEQGERARVELICFNIIVDENNETFYSDELGRMYYKETNKLVTSFLYQNRDSFQENSL